MAKKSNPRREQHFADVGSFKDLHSGGCLTGHASWYAASNPCSYRGQARKRAETEPAMYRWPSNYPLQPKYRDQWDLENPENFKKDREKPYWHEAHHIIPHAELNNAIAWVGEKALKQQADPKKHDAAPNYKRIKAQLVQLSEKLRVNIVAAGKKLQEPDDALDNIEREQLLAEPQEKK